ncbi:haloalkane dehalogenase [Thiohalorhabdus sp.]|uniref:haloalkane dehalogenase n=1 Tax=Thiohalorhabdus sp. TaxID=3094134 RepID=UPI002FC3ADA6
MEASQSEISPAFNHPSRFVEIDGARMHYVDEGEGPVILFLHGNPTWSYLWRNILPWLTPHARCIAPDLIGMGRSDKPDIAYRFGDHARYLEAFIEALGLSQITLVGHDWGSALGLDWARRNPAKVQGIALMEAILFPSPWSEFPAEFRLGFRLMRTPGLGWVMLSLMNGFVEQVLPAAVVRDLAQTEMAHYRDPYPTVRSRRPTRQWPLEIPIEGRPEDVHEIVAANNSYLQQTSIPKLLLYAHPGGLVRAPTVAWCRDHLTDLQVRDVGEGIHFLQEDKPHAIGHALRDWYWERVAG